VNQTIWNYGAVGRESGIHSALGKSTRPATIWRGGRLALAASVFLLPWHLHGLGVRVPDQDPCATARGNAFVATADNPSAIYYNPAGITQLEGNEVRAGVYAITLQSTYTSAATGKETDSKRAYQGVPQVYYTHSFNQFPVAAGLGLYAPYGLSLDWPDDTGFRDIAKEGSITYLTLNPVLALRVSSVLSIAAGPTLNYSEAKLRRGIGLPGDDFRFQGDDTAVGFNLGILWQMYPKLSFGASYRSPTTLNYDGHTDNTYTGSQSASAEFHFPRNIIGGISFRPTTNWNFEVNVDWTDWDSLNTVLVKQSPPLQLPFNWRSSFFYEFGATRFFGNGMHVSAGYIYSENSVPDASFNPAVPDSDRHIFSFGVGQQYQRLRWDAAYQFAWGPARTVSGSPVNINPFTGAAESADGRYEFISHALTVSLGYSF